MVEMVDRPEDLANAIAINASVFNGARLVGPAIAGIVICVCRDGEWPCFLLNALSYIPVIASLFMMRITRAESAQHRQGFMEGFNEGIEYVAGSLPIRSLLILVSLVAAMAAPLSVLMPVMAKQVLHGGADMLGLLTASLGVGALAASLFLASRKSVLGLLTVIALATGGFGICLGALACSHAVWLSAAILCITGFTMIAQFAAVNMVLQTIVDEGKRGRVMSFYTMAFLGVAPLGSVLSGYMASRMGVAATLVFCGTVCISASLVFTAMLPSLRHAMRTIYVRVGVLVEPEPAFAPAIVGILGQETIESTFPTAVGEAA
jgi:MFS family permease